MKLPWKKNINKVPRSINQNLLSIKTELISVAATKKISLRDIEAGIYSHVGLSITNGTVVANSPVLTSPAMGKWSERNVYGWELKRKDLAMITKTYIWETPNFGDGSTYGWHTHYQDREVYQKQVFLPRHLKIVADILSTTAKDIVLVKFSIDQLLDITRDDFDNELLMFLNILQENTGVANVYPSNATKEDFLETIMLDWEVFPPGTIEDFLSRMTKGKNWNPTNNDKVIERKALFDKLKPKAYLRGTGSFGSYFGAQFADDLVVFENLHYGNALYILYDNWEEVSKRSRLDLLKGTDEKFDRFAHVEGWQKRFKDHMDNELKNRCQKKK